MLFCKTDCNFAALFKSNFTANVTTFLKGALPYMTSTAGALCSGVFSQYVNLTSSDGTISKDSVTSILGMFLFAVVVNC